MNPEVLVQMGRPKPRPYRVTKARQEWASAIVWASSAAEAEQLARDDLYLEWDFEAGDYVHEEEATMLRGEERIWNGTYASPRALTGHERTSQASGEGQTS